MTEEKNISECSLNKQKYTVKQLKYISEFVCNSSKCMQNCCSKYSRIAVDEDTIRLYSEKAPELLKNIGKDNDGYFLQLNDDDICPHLKDSICEIQCNYGEKFVPLVCLGYPRFSKVFGDKIHVISSLNCIEMVKSLLLTENPFEWQKVKKVRFEKFRIIF